MFDEFRYGPGAGGSARKQGGAAAQPARVSQRDRADRILEEAGKPRLFVLGGNGTTLATISSFRPAQQGEKGATLTARLIPLAWTPAGVVIGTGRQNVGIPPAGVLDWIDRTFPAEDESAFIASGRDVEMLMRVAWESPFPEQIDQRAVLNIEDLPEEILDALARPQQALSTCASCRSLCVHDDFVWKEKQLCAWDYHAQVFGKRGPWRDTVYEERHFESLPACAYVAPPLLDELGVEEVLSIGAVAPQVAYAIVNTLIQGEGPRAYMTVKTASGFSVLRET